MAVDESGRVRFGSVTRRPTEQDIAQYFDERIDCCAPRRDAADRPGVALARVLEGLMREAGLAQRSVLELGCGRGELSFELLRAGAARVTGIDLSPDNIAAAVKAAAEDGLGGRLEFHAGNAAEDDLPRTDVVVHHRVICCYPDASAFLGNSIGAAGSVYGFSMPRSAGPIGPLVRVGMFFENAGHRLKRRGFRAYVHDERIVDAALRAAGFRLHGRRNRRGWFAAVYTR
jgi:magnesium-protoporphyrin O-methyltransferase